ncbi:MAG: hypothetical protein JO069_10595 [Verrucomicrobia bacterium]|nr:hypothetical protein [Verrucomicrobiota bacterium]
MKKLLLTVACLGVALSGLTAKASAYCYYYRYYRVYYCHPHVYYWHHWHHWHYCW